MVKTETMDNSRTRTRARALSADDEIVISGISGKFPNAQNVEEFAKNLYNKVNLSFNSIHSHLIIKMCCVKSIQVSVKLIRRIDF